MSHVAEIKTKIKTVNEGLLREALELMHKAEPQLTYTKAFKNWQRNEVPCDVAIYSPELSRGLGINYAKNGQPSELNFIGDDYENPAEYTRLQKLLLDTYTTLGVQRSLVQLGHGTTVTSQGNRNFVEALRA
jgi:uncharacterized protein YfkK (UPF0435 family)